MVNKKIKEKKSVKRNSKSKKKQNFNNKSKTKYNKSKSKNKTKSKKKSCYKLSNPYHDVLIYNYFNNKSKVSNSDKKKLCKLIKLAKDKNKTCLQEADITTIQHDLNKFKLKCL